jgi:hypothetical protein
LPYQTEKARTVVNDDIEIESSPLSGEFTRDSITVRVEIYRLRSRDGGWALEVVDQQGASTVWDEDFPTDQDAYREFRRTIESEGIRAFLDPSPLQRH